MGLHCLWRRPLRRRIEGTFHRLALVCTHSFHTFRRPSLVASAWRRRVKGSSDLSKDCSLCLICGIALSWIVEFVSCLQNNFVRIVPGTFSEPFSVNISEFHSSLSNRWDLSALSCFPNPQKLAAITPFWSFSGSPRSPLQSTRAQWQTNQRSLFAFPRGFSGAPTFTWAMAPSHLNRPHWSHQRTLRLTPFGPSISSLEEWIHWTFGGTSLCTTL